jgi:hypothetical protein
VHVARQIVAQRYQSSLLVAFFRSILPIWKVLNSDCVAASIVADPPFFGFDLMAQRSLPTFSFPQLPPIATALALAAIGLLLSFVAMPNVLSAYFAFLLSLLITIGLSTLYSLRATEAQPKMLQTLLDLSRDQEIARMHLAFSESLDLVASQKDPIFRSLAHQRLQSTIEQSRLMGAATIDFPSTESWRVVYEELLRSPGLHLYRSVSYIESAHYWQDGPGQQSTRLNLELQDAGIVNIERIAVIADHLWPDGTLFPIEPIHSWLDEQHRHGIRIRLLRESDVGTDTDLLNDFGIYGNRAVGMQLADPAGRTIRFVLSFDFEKLRQAEAQWSRLTVYSVSYAELLDRKH